MARGDFNCPIDGTNMGLPVPTLRYIQGQVQTAIGDHEHMQFNLTLTCTQGHQWKIVADIILDRVV